MPADPGTAAAIEEARQAIRDLTWCDEACAQGDTRCACWKEAKAAVAAREKRAA